MSRHRGHSRNSTVADLLISHADNMLRTLFASAESTRRSPAAGQAEQNLSRWEKDEAARLMRVNHTGEVCAQALYQGQSLTAKDAQLQKEFQQAAAEETDHLAWCEQRIRALGGRTSVLNPLFYASSYSMGALVGLLGDRASAAFLAQTEYQVAEHLTRHLERLPVTDHSSRKVIKQMRTDELKHAQTAENSGAISMSEPAKGLMRILSKMMTRTSYWM